MVSDYQRVRRACEQSRDAALAAAAGGTAPSRADAKAGDVCRAAWDEAFSGLSGRSLDLGGSDLCDMAFAWCENPGFTNASFRAAKLDRTVWYFVQVNGADFSQASMRECRAWALFNNGTSFRGADLTGAFLALLGSPVDFSDANLTGATVSLVGGEKVNFAGAKMAGCKIMCQSGKDRKALLASLSADQRAQLEGKRWWEFWK